MLGKVIKEEGSQFIYEYDFGDSWKHEITVEKILRPGGG
jgi:Plasmid pRiA4b ORF-3-like protein